MMTSNLPLHGGLADIANRIAKRVEYISFACERLRSYEPVMDGSAKCPACHILKNKSSKLAAVGDRSDEVSQYECRQCPERYQLGR